MTCASATACTSTAGNCTASENAAAPLAVQTRHLVAYAATLGAMLALDLLWLGVIAKPIYQRGIGHLMAEQPNIIAAAVFYAVFALGLTIFAVSPSGPSAGWAKTAGTAALFGFFAYATYNLTNLATLRGWPVGLALLDMAWGTGISAVAALAGRAALEHFGAG